MKHIVAALTLALGFSSVADAAVEYMVQTQDCESLAVESESIARKYEEGVERSEVLYHLLNKKKLNRDGYLATAPILFSITMDIYSGVLAIPADKMHQEVSDMCQEQLNTLVSIND